MTTRPNHALQRIRTNSLGTQKRLAPQARDWVVRPPRRSMRTHHIVTTGLMGLLTVLAVGCSRMTADEEHDVRLSFGLPADIPMKDHGVVELRVGIPKRVHAGWGKDCTVTATELTNGSVQLKLLYESKGEV